MTKIDKERDSCNLHHHFIIGVKIAGQVAHWKGESIVAHSNRRPVHKYDKTLKSETEIEPLIWLTMRDKRRVDASAAKASARYRPDFLTSYFPVLYLLQRSSWCWSLRPYYPALYRPVELHSMFKARPEIDWLLNFTICPSGDSSGMINKWSGTCLLLVLAARRIKIRASW